MLQFVEKLVSRMTHWQLLNVRISHSTKILEKRKTEFYKKKITWLLWFKCLDLIHAHLFYEEDIEAIWIFEFLGNKNEIRPSRFLRMKPRHLQLTIRQVIAHPLRIYLCLVANIKRSETKNPKCINVLMLDLIIGLQGLISVEENTKKIARYI